MSTIESLIRNHHLGNQFIHTNLVMSERNTFVILIYCLIFSTCLVIHQVNFALDAPSYTKKLPGSGWKSCLGKTSWMSQKRMATRGKYWVLYNIYKAARELECFESVTYVTQGEYQYLDNLWPVLQRWQGPISVAVYAPGTDYIQALDTINYYRHCLEYSPQIVQWVSFHIFYPVDHQPANLNVTFSACRDFRPSVLSYRKAKQLDYPVNVARMIARESATTHYVFTSDIELYPSPNLISSFLQMIQRIGQQDDTTVFVTPIFEIKADASMPANKKELVEMLHNQTAIIFHQNFCEACHKIPHYVEWLMLNSTSSPHQLSVFKVAKRRGLWEPIYIGTNQDPPYDERLSWEGRSDKMVQVSRDKKYFRVSFIGFLLNRDSFFACLTINSPFWTTPS